MAKPQPFRLSEGGLIDRNKPIDFKFNGQGYCGFEGDSLASALLANGVKVVARSFKYHRPRGIYTAGEEEPSALVELGRGSTRIPSCRAPAVKLHDGLTSRSQKGWPSLDFDLGRIVDYTRSLWPAGFYNKTFKWPGWHTWESSIRRSSGLGRVPNGPDPDHYERMNWHCDLLICGGGLAGLTAALIAGRSGMRVLLAEQDWEFGGAALGEKILLNDRPAMEWVARVLSELKQLSNVLLLTGTTVTGLYDHKVATLVQAGDGGGWRECYWQVRPRNIVLATGAIEQGLIFPNNDRPGIMLAGAVRDYLNRFAVIPAQHIAIACNNDSAYQTAIDLVQAGASVVALIDEREYVPEKLSQRLADLGVSQLLNTRITDTSGTRGIRSIRVKTTDGETQKLDCDLLAVSGGWAPRVHLLSHAGGRLRFDSESHCFIPHQCPEGIHIAGSISGPGSLSDALEQANNSVQVIGRSLGISIPSTALPEINQQPIFSVSSTWQPPRGSAKRQWIDLAHDVTTHDAALAVQEGFESVEHFKRYTTAGMSVDQGKTSNTNAFLVLSDLTGSNPDETGTTTYRPPYSPVSAGVMAAQANGDLYAPHRFLPAHAEHEALGALFEDFGWQRPECYPLQDETPAEAISREVLAVRNDVGVFDNSPIGKLEVCGPDAANFLDRFYINDIRSLKPGKARYGLMLNENAVIIDDGIVICINPEHFIVHTTSANAQRINDHMEEWLQCEWPDLQLVIHNATSQWANFTVAGPKSRELLDTLDHSFDISPRALPHMSVTQGSICGTQARLSRVSFSGELSYEINVRASHASALLKSIVTAGEPFAITPFGVEALMVLRIEKGYLHVGSETDGSTTPDDVGWGEVARRKNRDFIGRRSLFRAANTANDRKQLVGLEPVDPDQTIPVGGHLLIGRDRQFPTRTDGWVTSACYSPTLGRHISLAMLRDGQAQHAKSIRVYDQGQFLDAKVVTPTFYDPDNTKLS